MLDRDLDDAWDDAREEYDDYDLSFEGQALEGEERDLEEAMTRALDMSCERQKGLITWLMNDPQLVAYMRVACTTAQHNEVEMQRAAGPDLTSFGLELLRDLLARFDRARARAEWEERRNFWMWREYRCDPHDELGLAEGTMNTAVFNRLYGKALEYDGSEPAEQLTRADMMAHARRGWEDERWEYPNPKKVPHNRRRHWRRARAQRRIAARREQLSLDREIVGREDLLLSDVERDAAFEKMIANDDGGAWEQYIEHCEWSYEYQLAEEDRRNGVEHFYTEWYWDLYDHRTGDLDDAFADWVCDDDDSRDLDKAMPSW